MNFYPLILCITFILTLVFQPFSLLIKGGLVLLVAIGSYVIHKRSSSLSWPIVIIHLLLLSATVIASDWMVTVVLLLCFFLIEAFSFHLETRERVKKEAWHDAFTEMASTEEMFRTVRAERHDYVKHISTVHYLLEMTRIEEAKAYLDEYVGSIRHVSSYIKGEDAHIASILYRITEEANRHHVRFSLQCTTPLSALPLKAMDQVNVFMNLLENSLDAAKASAEKEIVVKTSTHGGIYIIEITNSTLPLSRERQEHLFSPFHVTEKGGHHQGLGTWIVKQTIGAHHGHINYAYKPPYLEIKIKVPIVKDS
ncbi:sensor histidine kinase [Metabacillus iocasae]|uniref:LytT family two-component system sensor histidine kinase NatK n=1 Tax=Priestia iocasae TaxID=2291674 RepID=A0ABS2QS02_9BACI|nr:GHKL domain-containing protein [Metabacillus iocasae]MBM7702236.1 LytT family two-component system sensor histidine kinase NatK [Metabacillus iocasae]